MAEVRQHETTESPRSESRCGMLWDAVGPTVTWRAPGGAARGSREASRGLCQNCFPAGTDMVDDGWWMMVDDRALPYPPFLYSIPMHVKLHGSWWMVMNSLPCTYCSWIFMVWWMVVVTCDDMW